jgi:hypothetical protein
VMGRDEMGVDGKPEYPETVVDIVIPDGGVPLGGSAFQQFAGPRCR